MFSGFILQKKHGASKYDPSKNVVVQYKLQKLRLIYYYFIKNVKSNICTSKNKIADNLQQQVLMNFKL